MIGYSLSKIYMYVCTVHVSMFSFTRFVLLRNLQILVVPCCCVRLLCHVKLPGDQHGLQLGYPDISLMIFAVTLWRNPNHKLKTEWLIPLFKGFQPSKMERDFFYPA